MRADGAILRSRRDRLAARRAAGERGAIAVEAAMILSLVLMPLLLGVITYGSYFWQAQKAEPLAARLPLDSVVGTFNCAQLVDRVKTTVQNALPSVTNLFSGVLPLDAIGVRVIDVLPTIGVELEVSVSVPALNTLGGLLPLPNGGSLVSEATYRLDNVKLTTAGC
jgi:hypothetical protein